METSTAYQNYLAAQKQVKEIKGFYFSLLLFIIVNASLAYINLKYSPQYLWFLYPFFSWGLGVFFHAIKVFNFMPFLNKSWEEKKIKEFMEEEKLKKSRNEYK